VADTVGSQPRSRRRRGERSGLTVADLLAQNRSEPSADSASEDEPASTGAHALREPADSPADPSRAARDELPTPRADRERSAPAERVVPAERPAPERPAPVERTDQLILGGAAPGESATETFARIPEPKTGDRPAAPAAGRTAPPTGGRSTNRTDGASTNRADGPSGAAPDEPDADELALRARRIDESLVRLTAIHAGLGADVTRRVSRSDTDDPDDPPADADPADTPGRPSGLVRLGRTALVALAGLLFVTTGVGWGAKNSLESELRSVAALDPNSDSIVDKAGQYGDENYLLVGSDTRAGSDAEAGAGTASDVPGARSDTVMLAHIPASRDRVVLVSFPRDLEVDRPGCDRWDPVKADYPGGTSPAQRDVKLNTAFEIGGPRCVTKVIQKITGLSVNHFTAIDFAGFKEMVDAVSGVPICVERPVVDSVLGRVVPTSGESTLNGDQALAFVRARHVRGDPTSDYGRIERQQRFLSALLRKGLSEQVLLDPGKLKAFVAAFGSHTLSDNTGLDELTTLGSSLRSIDPAKVTFVTVPTQGEPNAAGNEVLRKADADALFGAVRADQQLPGESAPAADQAQLLGPGDTLAPSRVSLAVRNGSEESGLANKVAENLRTVGFTVSKVGDADSSSSTVIRHSADRAEQAATVAAAVPGATTKEVAGESGLLELVLGDGFDGEVKAPVGASAVLPAGVNTVNAADASCR
jgi:LCP family protein required for cell wall assembly